MDGETFRPGTGFHWTAKDLLAYVIVNCGVEWERIASNSSMRHIEGSEEKMANPSVRIGVLAVSVPPGIFQVANLLE